MSIIPSEATGINETNNTITVSDSSSSSNSAEIKKPDQPSSDVISLIASERAYKEETNDSHLSRLQNLRNELNYISETDWMYESLEKKNGNKDCEQKRNLQNIVDNFIDQNDDLAHAPTIIPKPFEDKEVKESACFSRKGVITHLTEQSGIIDNILSFEKDITREFFDQLTVGSVIEYISYKDDNDVVKVIKIQKIIEYSWEKTTDAKLSEMLESLKMEQPTYFNMQLRNILGFITQRLASAIEVDTEYGKQTVKLDNIESNFIPKTGDEITMECQVQVDESFVNKQGEILQVRKIFPTRIQKNMKCTVEGVFEELIELSADAYVLRDDVPKGTQLHIGDIVKADLIECKFAKYSQRAIKLDMLEKDFGQVNNNPSNTSSNRKHAINIKGEESFVFSEQWKKYQICLKLENVSNRIIELKSIKVVNEEDGQIKVVEPLSPRSIEVDSQTPVVFEVHTKLLGESKEYFTLQFDTFRVKRYVTIILCQSGEEAVEAKRRLDASEQLKVRGRDALQRSRFYAYETYSKKCPVVPGESVATRRRFLHRHLPSYEVPKTMYTIVLKTETLQEVKELLSNSYPYLNEGVSFGNYSRRFAALLHLEEINYNISFRNYDRERAHFNREGEFLALHIENLAERRPSLVLGDTVHAINPWDDGEKKDNKVFQGVVHKVFFNRIHLKFNSNFQQKYNGEDYRLEFHFSRYALRKQHYAVSHIGDHMGENFLFPSKISKREHVQLDVTLKDDNMHLYDDQLPWFNPELNSIQKIAICNILRGETENMPYVIFGPPGTGKTVTLVETILQLVRNVPGSRLLVGTPSNSSADLITKRIIDSKVLSHGDFIRLVSQNQVEKDLISPDLAGYCATADIGIIEAGQESMIVTDSGLKLRCQAKFLGKHRITISTCTTLGNFLQMDFEPEHFTHVLIDEAGQCTEPETMVPIALLSRKRSQVILAGDPHQLQAVVASRHASALGLGVSYLERLLQSSPYSRDIQRFPQSSGYNPCVLTKLLNNYRALPSIMAIYSKLFYDNELISMVSEEDSRELRLLAELQSIFEPNLNMPRSNGAFFHGIVGENMQDLDSPSWYNLAEAREVFLMTILLYRRNILPEQIGILTPYAKQVKTLRDMFISADVNMPKIGSVEEFQGQERDIMLISTVRSSEANLSSDARYNLGFVSSNKRMNVAISRARCLMVIFGNPYLLSVDDCWRHLILFCANNNAYFGCDLPKAITLQGQESDSGQSDTDQAP